MTSASSSMRDVVLEPQERTCKSSRAEVQRFIDSEQSELKIISLESQITAPVELRDRERTCVAALRHLDSPIHSLPVELLAEIFEFVICNQQPIASRRYIQYLLRISQVCSDWRQVTHSTPRLWARPMEIDLRARRSSTREQVHADSLKTQLLRAAPLTVPVSLLLDWESRNRSIPDEILCNAPRWRSLYFPDMATFLVVRQLAKARLENLEVLDLGGVDFPESDIPLSFSASTVPRLQKLHIGIYTDVLPILLPWAQLSHLILRTRCPDVTLDILYECTNLLQVDVHTTVLDGFLEDIDVTLTHNRLHALSLHFLEAEGNVLRFLDHLSAPALEEIFLDFGHVRRQVWTMANFTEFQLRSPNITRLELLFCFLTSDELTTALRHAPSLTHLKLTHCHYCFDDALIDALRYKAGTIPLAPHLHNLHLEDIRNDFTEDLLAGMIASRWWTDAELASRLVPPPVARWTHVQLPYPFGQHFMDVLHDVPSDVVLNSSPPSIRPDPSRSQFDTL